MQVNKVYRVMTIDRGAGQLGESVDLLHEVVNGVDMEEASIAWKEIVSPMRPATQSTPSSPRRL